MGFYTLSLVCLALILKFGVLVAVHPPQEKLRGLFVLACGVAGFAGGGVSIFFWQQTKYFIGAWGGFSIGLWVQCFRSGGLIGPIGFRWVMYSGICPCPICSDVFLIYGSCSMRYSWLCTMYHPQAALSYYDFGNRIHRCLCFHAWRRLLHHSRSQRGNRLLFWPMASSNTSLVLCL